MPRMCEWCEDNLPEDAPDPQDRVILVVFASGVEAHYCAKCLAGCPSLIRLVQNERGTIVGPLEH